MIHRKGSSLSIENGKQVGRTHSERLVAFESRLRMVLVRLSLGGCAGLCRLVLGDGFDSSGQLSARAIPKFGK